jgi:polyisoprenoid-binding protein YceI
MTTGESQTVGPQHGQLLLRTSRTGLAAQVGHDLTIEVSRWSGRIAVAQNPQDSSVEITADLGSLIVLEGKRGVKPLSDKDRREIVGNARKILDVDRHGELRYTSSQVAADGTVEGTLHLHGVDKPFQLRVSDVGNGRYRAVGDLLQSDFGIKPYSGFFGALKLADKVEMEVELDLSGAAG